MRTFLIAVSAPTERAVHEFLLASPLGPGGHHQDREVEEWWVAEDDRIDGSDNDSAIFVPRGSQDDMRSVLDNWFDANEDRFREEGYPYASTDVTGVWFKEALAVARTPEQMPVFSELDLSYMAGVGDRSIPITYAEEPEFSASNGAIYGEGWMVQIEYNTEADGTPVPDEPGTISPRTLHGPFDTEALANEWIEQYPLDGNTDVHEIFPINFNRVRPKES